MDQINLFHGDKCPMQTTNYDNYLNPTDRKCLSIFMEYLYSNNFEEALRLIQNKEYSYSYYTKREEFKINY